jgi:hypothetical protein
MRRFPVVMARLNIAKHGGSTGLAAIGRLVGGLTLVGLRKVVGGQWAGANFGPRGG